MPAQITAVDVISILGQLSDEGGPNSSRNRFIQSYLAKYEKTEPIIADIENLLSAYRKFDGDRDSLERAYGDLVNRLAEVTGFSVDYVKYSAREKITGVWRVGEAFQIKVAAMICENYEETKGVARNALLILPEAMELGRPFVTIGRLGELFTMVEQIELPVSSIASILLTEDNYDKRIESFMDLMVLAFKKELSRKSLKVSLNRRWEREELEDFITNRLKLPTAGMFLALSKNPLNGEELTEEINGFLQSRGVEKLKNKMALGAMMGALSKHYSGIKEELVLREGKRYFLSEKYRPIICEIVTGLQKATQLESE